MGSKVSVVPGGGAREGGRCSGQVDKCQVAGSFTSALVLSSQERLGLHLTGLGAGATSGAVFHQSK